MSLSVRTLDKPRKRIMISLLLSIPVDIIRDRIAPFIDVLSLCMLDTATLSKEYRPHVLSSILHNVLLADAEIRYDKNMTKWLLKRGICVQSIVFPEDSEPSDLELATPVLALATVIHLIDCVKLTNESVQLLLQKCGSLDSLVLAGCTWLKDDTLRTVAKHHTGLLEYILGDCPLITDAGTAHVLNKCPEIGEVQWDNCENVGKQAMAALANHAIVSLFISNCPGITDASLVKFFQHNKNKMDSAIISENEQLTDKSLLAMAQHCTNILDLNVSECASFGDAGLCAVIESCQRLTALRADDCNISAVVLDKLSTHVSPHLETLWLMPCATLTEQHVSALVARSPRLTELRFSSCEGVSNRALQSIGANCAALQALSLELCANVSLQGIRSLVLGCPELVELHLLMCTGVCDHCLLEIAVHCKNLRHLRVVDNGNITDSGVRALALHCRQLEQVCFSYTAITDVAVEHLIECCPGLLSVVLQGRQAVAQSLVKLCERRNVTLTLADKDHDEFEEVEIDGEDDGSEEDGFESEEELGVYEG